MKLAQSLALLEIGNLAPSLLAADRCVKSAGVTLLSIENTDSGAMCLKLAGDADSVAAAAKVGADVARRMGASVFVTVLPGPAAETMTVVQSPPVFSPLINAYDVMSPRKEPMENAKAIGLLETQGLVAVLHATDVMLKTSSVTIVGKEKIGGGFVTIMVRGDLAAVQAAIEAGKHTVEQLGGKLILADWISNPHPDLAALLPA